MKNFLLFIFCVLVSSAAFGQTTIFNVTGGGTLPSGWTGTNNVTANLIDRTSYYLVEAGATSDILETAVYDLSAYTAATFTLNVATFGSGTANPAKIEISNNGGSSYTQVATSNTPSSSSYIAGGSISVSSLTSQVKIRITNNGTTGTGVRLQSLKLVASGSSAVSNVNFSSATSAQTETNATFAATIPVTLSNYAGSQVDLSVTVTGGTAEAGDYTLNTTALSFTANSTQNVSIDINPDADIDNETIQLTIAETTATGATITTSVHTITVSDDDGILCSTPVWTIVEETLNSQSDTWVESSGNYTVNGFVGTASASDLWLVYGPLDMSGTSTLNLNFDLVQSFAGDPLNFKYSTDYAGDVSTATWTSVQSLTGSITGASVNYGAATGTNTYIAIQYTATGLGSGGSASYALNNITMEADICPSAPCLIASVAATSACDGDNAEFVVTWTDAGTSGTIEVDINGEGYQTMTSGGTYTIVGPTAAATGVTVTVRDANDVTCSATTTVDILECPVIIPGILITEIADPTDNANARFIEITNRDTSDIDVSGWTIQVYINGSSTAGGTYTLPSSTTLTPNQGWAVAYSASAFQTAYGLAPSASYGNFNTNGDDAYVLKDATGAIIDIFGVVGVDGTGQAWEYTDAIAKRNADITTPNATWTASEWTIAAGNVADAEPLPVELLYFSAKPNNQTALLTWATATEENNAYFNIQRSTDGKNFETIGTKTGAGTTYNVQEYSFIDKKPSNGLNYYRLQQVDFDGKFENHKIVSVLINGQANDVQVYPNPTRGTLNIVLPTIGENEIQIVDLTGKIVRTLITNQEAMTTLDISDLPNGQYIIKICNAETTSTALFVKTK